jgi:hypothetical protein
MCRTVTNKGKSRRGGVVLELILVTPIIVAALVGGLEYGMLNITQAGVTHAATVAAREAAKLNPSDDIVLGEVVGEVNAVLGTYGIVLSDTAGSGTKLVIEDGLNLGSPLVFGDPGLACPPPAGPSLNLDEVRVTLCIEFSATKLNGAPVINAFDLCGFTFDGKRFHISSVVKKELD